ncbi:uncharacterized protein LOC117417040 isoform X2 [Acipenser ruthenus]|uniref:uncharacterized protein LOC117417040 isoform X2 n=1 Tax=Acipenser ruthenus TaxID=7906 RepID=UPI002741F791|nr:uncharacterized protein LOC117417040 isoform X2 [Acipenser ruthenus]
MECKVVTCNLASEAGKEQGNGREGPYIIDVMVDNVSTHALVGSGCAQTLIQTSLLGGMSWQPQGKVAISCIHVDTATYPTLKAYVSIGQTQRHLTVGVVERLPHPVLGRDWPQYRQLIQKAVLTAHVNVPDRAGETIGEIFPLQADLFNSLFCPRKTKKERRIEKGEGASLKRGWGLVGESADGIKRHSRGVGTQCDREGEITGPSRTDVTPAPLNVPDMWGSSADLVWDQKNDPTLVHAWGQVRSIEGVTVQERPYWIPESRRGGVRKEMADTKPGAAARSQPGPERKNHHHSEHRTCTRAHTVWRHVYVFVLRVLCSDYYFGTATTCFGTGNTHCWVEPALLFESSFRWQYPLLGRASFYYLKPLVKEIKDLNCELCVCPLSGAPESPVHLSTANHFTTPCHRSEEDLHGHS